MTQLYSVKSRNRGFTLLEIMLVMVLMAVVISSVTLSFDIRSTDKKVEDEAKRFHAVYQLASDYALLNNLQLGMAISPTRYQFLVFDGEGWQTINDDKVLSPHELEEGFQLELTLGELDWLDDGGFDLDKGLFSDDDEDDDSKIKKVIPQIYLFSSGEITPFTLRISYELAFSGEDKIEYQIVGDSELPLKVENMADLTLE